MRTEPITEPVNNISNGISPHDKLNVIDPVKIKSEYKSILIIDSDDEWIIEAEMQQLAGDKKKDVGQSAKTKNIQKATTNAQNLEVIKVQTVETIRPTTEYFTPRSTKHGKRNEFSHSKSRNRHVTVNGKRRVRKEGPFRCENCSEVFSGITYLVFHRRLHLHSSSIYCCTCLRQFTTNFRKKIHEKACKAVRFECYLCGAKKLSIQDLKRHMPKHTGIKAYGIPVFKM